MTPNDIRSKVLAALTGIAPETDPAQIRPQVSLRDQLDIDSMDFLKFAIALHKEFEVDIPERDYSKLATLDGCVNYLSRALRGGG
jgi:acyl carrier protein